MNNRTPALSNLNEMAMAKNLSAHIEYAGPIGCFVEPTRQGLHQVFFLRVRGRDWIGRKVLQRDADHRWSMSSLLNPAMLLGPHLQSQWSDDGVSFYFHTATLEERAEVFQAARKDLHSEIHFPFTATDHDGNEAVCPADYWQGHESLAEQLNADELHFREHCVAVLGPLLKPGDLVYDPACSTGEFIACLAAELAGGHFVGSDRSATMIEYARRHHADSRAEYHVMEAARAADAGMRCDVLILRFLNAEVLTRREANCAFSSLLRCVKPAGTILLFGHTPVLSAVPWLAYTHGLARVSSTGARSGHQELFQFYHMKAPCP